MNSDPADRASDPHPVDEVVRMNRVYTERRYDTDPEYSESNPVYQQRVQRMERAVLGALGALRLDRRIGELDVLDFGCGNGRWFGRWRSWGASGSRLTGVDLRESVVDLARRAFPDCRFVAVPEGALPFPDESFDVVVQSVTFSSILSDEIRGRAAREILRVLRPCGVLMSYDLAMNNPRNPNVRALRRKDLDRLFPGTERVRAARITLAPPLARLLVPRWPAMAELLESCCPFLRTHLHAILRKVPGRERVAIRPGTAGDVARIVDTHLRSFPGFFLTFLGPRFLALLYRRFVSDSDTICHVAVADGEVVGFVAGVTRKADFYRRLIRHHVLSFALSSLTAIIRKPGVIPRIFNALRRPAEAAESGAEACLMSLGVRPDFHRRGIASRLVDELLADLRRLAAPAVSLTTDRDDNEGANAFYRRLGFALHRSFTTREGREMNEYVIEVRGKPGGRNP